MIFRICFLGLRAIYLTHQAVCAAGTLQAMGEVCFRFHPLLCDIIQNNEPFCPNGVHVSLAGEGWRPSNSGSSNSASFINRNLKLCSDSTFQLRNTVFYFGIDRLLV